MMSKESTTVSEDTRALLKTVSKAMLRLHKSLLDQSKMDYELRNGPIASVNLYFQLVIDDPHFAWLRKISSLVAMIDEAVSLRQPTSEEEAVGLLTETEAILNFRDADQGFNDRFQGALTVNTEAVLIYNEILKLLEPSYGGDS